MHTWKAHTLTLLERLKQRLSLDFVSDTLIDRLIAGIPGVVRGFRCAREYLTLAADTLLSYQRVGRYLDATTVEQG